MRYDRVEDILRLALTMQVSYQGLSIIDIEEEFEVSRRTAIRMKDAVARLFPIMEEVPTNSRIKKWRLNKQPLNQMIAFTPEELAGLENCKQILRTLNYENRTDLLSEIIAKLNALNNSRSVITDIEALLEAEGYAVRQYPRFKISRQMLEIISESLKAVKYLTFTYKTRTGEDSDLKVQPYGIIYGEKTYLLAFNEEREDFRLYLLNKITNIQLLDEYFEKDEKFNLQDYVQKSFGVYQEAIMDIKLRFSKEAAENAKEYSFHPTQKIKNNEDGSIDVSFKAGGRHEICWHLFKWGSGVKILAPKELKDTYKQLIEDAKQSIE